METPKTAYMSEEDSRMYANALLRRNERVQTQKKVNSQARNFALLKLVFYVTFFFIAPFIVVANLTPNTMLYYLCGSVPLCGVFGLVVLALMGSGKW